VGTCSAKCLKSEETPSRALPRAAIDFPCQAADAKYYSQAPGAASPGRHGKLRDRNNAGPVALSKLQPDSRRRIMDRIVLKHGLWLLVADGERALFMENLGGAANPNFQVVREMEQDNPPTRDQGSDRPGRFNDGPSAHRSAVDDTDWHTIGKKRFADELADRLYRIAHRGDFREIILIAPPLVLGELRKKLHSEVSDKVVGELPKTLTNHTVYDIEKLLLAA
jgi:protein required for attachment to host cells